MKKNLLLIAALGTILLVSCGNTNSKVKEQPLKNVVGKNLETKASPPSTTILEKKEESVPAKPTYKEWMLGYGRDEYGDEVKDIKFILVDLDAYYPKNGETDKGISITYCHNKITGIELLAFSSSQSLGKYGEISFKTRDGYVIEFIGEYRGREGQDYSGSVVFYNIDDMKSIAEILNEGNFKIKVGYYVADVKDETKGFRESVEKYFKGEDIEILLPRITRE
jgi:hypothetical protein